MIACLVGASTQEQKVLAASVLRKATAAPVLLVATDASEQQMVTAAPEQLEVTAASEQLNATAASEQQKAIESVADASIESWNSWDRQAAGIDKGTIFVFGKPDPGC